MATAAQHTFDLSSLSREVAAWVRDVADQTQPTGIHWCDGSDAEFDALESELVQKKELLPLNQSTNPGDRKSVV